MAPPPDFEQTFDYNDLVTRLVSTWPSRRLGIRFAPVSEKQLKSLPIGESAAADPGTGGGAPRFAAGATIAYGSL